MSLTTNRQPPPGRWVGAAAAVGSRTLLTSELLCESVDLRAGERVLDVPCGSGSAALAAARRCCRAVGVDAPEPLGRARRRAQAEGLEVDFLEGDPGDLPVPDGAFDVVLSAGEAMAATVPEGMVGELLRACRLGGRIGLVAWTPDGYVGELCAAVGRRLPAPAGLERPVPWGTRERLRALGPDRADALTAELEQVARRFDVSEDDTLVLRLDYLEVVAGKPAWG